jgi:phage tail-like protein
MAAAGSAAPIINAARFVISFEGVEVTFSELTGISSEVEPAEDTSTDSTGATGPANPFGKTSPPTVTLTRGLDGNAEIWAWHTAVLAGDPAARKTCTLQLQDEGGQILLTFVMENAWPSKVGIAGQSGESQAVLETDEFVCDSIMMQPG